MNDTAGAPGKVSPLLELQGVSRRYGAVVAVEPTDLTLNSGEFFALLGPSGCGKTTLLRMIAGFEPPDGGRILFEGKDITALPPHLRPFNMMFQSYALFPHLSVFDNIAFGLRRAGVARTETRRRAEEMLRLVKLEGYGARGVHQLSGGQRQRVALARALARRPRLLLLDEPMAALDKSLRESTQFELMELQRALGLTFCVVTHDQDEAMMMANRIGVMEAGRLAQIGTPAEIYETPANRAVAAFVGDINLFDATVLGREGGQLLLSVPALGATFRDDEGLDIAPGTTVTFAIRPEKIAVTAEGSAIGPPPPNQLLGTIADIAYLGDWTVYRVRLSSGQIVRASRANALRRIAQPLAAGDAVEIGFSDDAGMVLLS